MFFLFSFEDSDFPKMLMILGCAPIFILIYIFIFAIGFSTDHQNVSFNLHIFFPLEVFLISGLLTVCHCVWVSEGFYCSVCSFYHFFLRPRVTFPHSRKFKGKKIFFFIQGLLQKLSNSVVTFPVFAVPFIHIFKTTFTYCGLVMCFGVIPGWLPQ